MRDTGVLSLVAAVENHDAGVGRLHQNTRGSGTNNTVAADTVATIPASARGKLHLPPEASLLNGQQRHAVDIANAV